MHYALPKSGRPGESPYFGTQCVVIAIDAHNGLQMGNTYTGLQYNSPSGRTMYQEYCSFVDELSHIAQAVYAYSDCAERFQMDERLDEEARTCAVLARSYGMIPYAWSTFWEYIKPFWLGMESGGRSMNCWHHTDWTARSYPLLLGTTYQ